MAEETDSSIDGPETDTTSLTQRDRARRFTARRPAAKAPARRSTAVATKAARPSSQTKPHPVRSFLTVAAVAGLVATVAIPAVVSADRSASADAVTTVQQVAAENAQSLVVASEATPEALDRDSYSATTKEEIDKKKAEEAAKKALAARLASRASSASFSTAVPLTIAASGDVVRPLTSFNSFGTPYAGHKGTDYMAGRGTPIYSIADGVVVASSESGPGWGVYVKIAHNIGGKSVTSLYAHMSYGTRRVTVGQTVSAGQLIGQVGDSGRAYGTHLHLEVVVGGAYQNAESWLQANAN
ncbi:M23 family metallopeptidase [Microbacterium invictum]|uniref:Murein DD-endopeptidase MepM/ murein hydrolase activator NlpD n=1 Tax=Microbacterium invictum TaxID=515415 RepID=A0AA40SLP2_9MICO|nr:MULTISPECIES: M23 family metallopeptidase [Microbacterium]MBB4138516.1 murein DD-endopeptidase MepM/ murein hydrolase activator NlpD [Microbacterium invictum]